MAIYLATNALIKNCMKTINNVLIVFLLFFSIISAQHKSQKTYCNPMDIGYRYNFEQIDEKISYRSAADPVIVTFKDSYYLFATISNGWWKSTDMSVWEFVTPSMWPMEDNCAPAVLVVKDTMLIYQSTFERRPILYTTQPETGKLKFYNRYMPWRRKEIGSWDPALFYDEDLNRYFMYWGSSNMYPIYGCELDHGRQLAYKDTIAHKFIYLHPEEHGWERFGLNHSDEIDPFIEGAWMTKHNGKYYLQYAAPGTEYNVYANGTYIGNDPLGPFTYAPYNPISYKPGGYVQGAGHGNTFQDLHGNYWNTGTPWIAVNWNFERRIAMFPAFFDKDDQFFSNTRFGDFPQYLPTQKIINKDELFTGWMLLSYKKPVTASSVRDTFSCAKITDENPRSYWVANTNKSGEWAIIDLQKISYVKAIQINLTDYKSNIYFNDSTVYTQFKFYTSKDNVNWECVVDLSNEKQDRPNGYFELENPIDARYIKFENIYVPTANLAINAIRIFGNSNDVKPETPKNLFVKRHEDERNATITWDKIDSAIGYNILWGIAKDKLYQTYQIFHDQGTKLELRALNKGVDYFFAIEAFNENGVSEKSIAISCE